MATVTPAPPATAWLGSLPAPPVAAPRPPLAAGFPALALVGAGR